MMPRLVYTVCCAYLLGCVCAAQGNTIYINPGDSIQAAINSATGGDELIINPGTYTGSGNRNLIVTGKHLTIRSSAPEDPTVVAATIIDCQGSAGAITFSEASASGSVLAGLTMQNGQRTQGGAVYIINCEVEIAHCRFLNNTARAGGALSLMSATLTLTDSQLEGNTAANDTGGTGGALDSTYSDVTVTGCEFLDNTAYAYASAVISKGGAIRHNRGNLHISRCTIEGNTATGDLYCHGNPTGGGAYIALDAGDELSMTDCTVRNNSATIPPSTVFGLGGGVYVAGDNTGVSATLSNCVISGNVAGDLAGGIGLEVPATLRNCTVCSNSCLRSTGIGGGVVLYDTVQGNLINCVLWANSSPSGPQLAVGANGLTPTANVTYCDVQGGASAVYVEPGATLTWSAGNINANPLFVDSGNGDYHLGAMSPCVDAATCTGAPAFDRDGQPRWDDPAHGNTGAGSMPYFEIGAYELPDVDADGLADPAETGTLSYVSMFDAGTFPDDPDSDDDGLDDGDEVHVRGTNPCVADTDGDGRSDGQELADATNPLHPDNVERTYYVDGVNGNDDVYDGLAAAWDGTHGPKQTIQAGLAATIAGWAYTVMVADGTYSGVGNHNLVLGGKDVTLRSTGGASACTIDCAGGMRAFTIASGETQTTVIDGFTFSNASADDSDGGAILCVESAPTIRNCVFTNNFADGGACIACDMASPTIDSCTFFNNEADSEGGAIACYDEPAPTIVNCVIVDNLAGIAGGGIHCNGSNPVITGCTIAGNEAEGSYGGGLSCNDASPTVRDCTIAGNSSGAVGGGVMCDVDSNPTLVNVRITGNSTTYDGGGLYVVDASPTLINCTIARNVAAVWSSGVYCDSGTTTIYNSIIRENTANQIYVNGGTLNLAYCNVQGGWAGTQIVDMDPHFMDPDGLDDDEETWTDNDFRLAAGSPSIDAGSNNFVPSGILTDLAGQARFHDDPGMSDTGAGTPPIVDHGCYEFGGTSGLQGDMNHDGRIDCADFELLLGCLFGPDITPGPTCEDGDLDSDNDVDLADFLVFQQQFTGP